MSEHVDRRFLLGGLAGAAGVAALSRLAHAGPLTPPAGAVAPSGRTLDEVYNRIAPVGAADGRTPIPGGAATFTISQPGSYVLTGNLTVSTAVNAIIINADNVDLDLNGFTVTGNPSANAVALSGTRRNVRIRNGVVREGAAGVSLGSASIGCVVEDVRFERCRIAGVRGLGGNAATVRRCTAIDIGATTTATDPSNIAGFTLAGSGHTVESCAVYNPSNAGTGAIFGIDFPSSNGGGHAARDCTVSGPAGGAIAGIGIRFFGATAAGSYRGCVVFGFATPYSGGMNAGGNV